MFKPPALLQSGSRTGSVFWSTDMIHYSAPTITSFVAILAHAQMLRYLLTYLFTQFHSIKKSLQNSKYYNIELNASKHDFFSIAEIRNLWNIHGLSNFIRDTIEFLSFRFGWEAAVQLMINRGKGTLRWWWWYSNYMVINISMLIILCCLPWPGTVRWRHSRMAVHMWRGIADRSC